MRRRDATTAPLYSSQRIGWPTTASFVLSIALHAIALQCARLAAIDGAAPTPVIRVSLLASANDGAAAGPPESAAAVAPSAPPARHQASSTRSARRIAVALHAQEDRARPPADVSSRSVDNEPARLAQLVGAIDGGAEDASGSSGRGVGVGDATGSGSGNQRPYCVYCPAPHYPILARQRGWQGTVLLGLSVLADGSVESASLRHSSGYGVLDREAILVARRSRFSPPATRGLSAPVRGPMEYRFELSNADLGRERGR